MIKKTFYKYLGVNGEILSEIFLPDTHSIKLIKLQAADNKLLTNGEKTVSTVMVLPSEVENWEEISR